MVITLLLPRKIWIGVRLESIPKPLSDLWVIHLPFWMLSAWGKTAKVIIFCSGIGVLVTSIIYLAFK